MWLLQILGFVVATNTTKNLTSLENQMDVILNSNSSTRWNTTLKPNIRCRGVYDLNQNTCLAGYFNSPSPMLDSSQSEDMFLPQVYGKVFPVLVLAIIVANIFVVLVLSQKHMVSPTNLILLYMAIADLFVGVVPLPFTFYYYTLQNYRRPREIEACYMYQYLMDALPPICHNVAMWLTVLLAAQRFLYIQYPVRSQSYCTTSKVKKSSVLILLVSLLCGLPKFFQSSFITFTGEGLVGREGRRVWMNTCLERMNGWVLSVGMVVYYNLFYWTRVVLFILIPSLLLILLNTLLIRGVTEAKRRKQRLLRLNRRREAHRETESNRTSLMLVIIVSIFLIVNLPQGIFLALVCVDNTFNLSLMRGTKEFGSYFIPLNNMLILATYPLNFTIYCSMSSQFRETFKRLFCRNLPPLHTSVGAWTSRVISRRSLTLLLRGRSHSPSRNGSISKAGESSVRFGVGSPEPPFVPSPLTISNPHLEVPFQHLNGHTSDSEHNKQKPDTNHTSDADEDQIFPLGSVATMMEGVNESPIIVAYSGGEGEGEEEGETEEGEVMTLIPATDIDFFLNEAYITKSSKVTAV